jgi:hypothetical protein
MPPPPDFDAIRSQALSGNAEAQHRLGEIYQDKNSTLHDDAASVVWLRKVADQRYRRREACAHGEEWAWSDSDSRSPEPIHHLDTTEGVLVEDFRCRI